jgi:GATA zinc finger
MSRENDEQEQYLDMRYINGPISHPSAVYNLNPAINGVAHNTEGQTIEELSFNSPGSDTKSYSYVMGSVQFTNVSSNHHEAFLQSDKSLLNTANYYNQPIQTLGTMQSMDAIGQVVSCSSLPAPGYYPPEYLATDYYSDPYRMPQDQTANSYLMENTVISKDTIRLSPIKFCSNCFTTETPSWRRCSEGKNLLCNACGL